MGRILPLDEVVEIVEGARAEGLTIVATNGCFDILHAGHVRNLIAAKALGDLLVVGVNSDSSVQENKGNARPILPENERAEVIAALACVDYVFLFSEKTPFDWISKIQPHFHVKGGSDDVRNHPDFAGQEQILAATGGTLVLVPHHEGLSTTIIIKKIIEAEDRQRNSGQI